MIDSLLVVTAPWLLRFSATTWEDVQWTDIILSMLPFLLFLPSSIILKTLIRSDLDEHIARHTYYALAFSVSTIAVNWDVVNSSWTDAWAQQLTIYFAVGGGLLWWFVFAHILENTFFGDLIYTHQGDVLVLPLTLLGITILSNEVPDEAMRFSRSVIYFVPVIVSWSSIMLIAYTKFATAKTTTLDDPAFDLVTRIGLVIGTIQLCLIEIQGDSTYYIIFPIVGTVLTQFGYRSDAPPLIRKNTDLGTILISGGISVAFGWLIRLKFGWHGFICSIFITIVASLNVRKICGSRWIVPATVLGTFSQSTVLYFLTEIHVLPEDVTAFSCAYFISFVVVGILMPTVYTDTPPTCKPVPDGNMPQLRASLFSVSGLARALDFFRFEDAGKSKRYRIQDKKEWLKPFFNRVDPNCPPEFKGVWWMEHNTFPMELITVHRRRWTPDGRNALFWNGKDITWHDSLSGWVMYLSSWLTWTELQVIDDKWIRTDTWKTPLRLFATTLWLYRVNNDHMIRLVLNSRGEVVWQYNMKRIAKEVDQTTPYMDDFLKLEGRRSFLLRLS